jgi:hypothetical protein
MTHKPALKNLKKLPYGGAMAVESEKHRHLVEKFIMNSATDIYNESVQQEFLQRYYAWIHKSQCNHLIGLENFPILAYCNGTTEAFDKFYLDNSSRRFRCLPGEYMYHMASWRNYFNWAYVENLDLAANDALVISLPFSDTGNKHPYMDKLLELAHQLKVPVLVDCAFFGICNNIDFDFSHPAITTVTFSLSKMFPVNSLRIGMRLTRVDDDDSLLVVNKTNYTNRLGAAVGLRVLNHVSADYNIHLYKENQLKFCNQLGIVPSDTVIFGLDYSEYYKEYNRGGQSNRLSFARYLESGNLPND